MQKVDAYPDGHRYWIQVGENPEQEVSKEDFIKLERQAGFYSKFGPNEVATGSFSNGALSGRTEIVDKELAWQDTLRILREDGTHIA